MKNSINRAQVAIAITTTLLICSSPHASAETTVLQNLCAASVMKALEKTPFMDTEMTAPPRSADILGDVGHIRITNPFTAPGVAKTLKKGVPKPDMPRVTVDLKSDTGMQKFKDIMVEYRRIMEVQKEAKDQAKKNGQAKPSFPFRIGGKIEEIIKNIERVLTAYDIHLEQDPGLVIIRKEALETAKFLKIKRHLLFALDLLATGLTRNFMSPIPLDKTVAELFKLGVMSKLQLLVPGIKPIPDLLWGERTDQVVPKGEDWRKDPIDGILWDSEKRVAKTDNLYQPPMQNSVVKLKASEAIPKTGYGAHWGLSGNIQATYQNEDGVTSETSIAQIKFRVGDDDTSRIVHRGEARTGPIGTSFVKALGYNSADIHFFGNLEIENDHPEAIRRIFKTSNIRNEFGWNLRAWTDGPIIPFSGLMSQNRQKYYNPFQVITEVGLKNGDIITDWKEFQKLYFTGDPATLVKKHKGEQKDENYNLEFEQSIAYVKVGPVSAESLPPKTKKKLKKLHKIQSKVEVSGQDIIDSLKPPRARVNLSSLDSNNNAYHSHKAIRGLSPLIAMLQAWDIRPENLRVTIYTYRDGTRRLAVRFSDWGSVLGSAKGFSGNTNADPNRYPLDIIKKVDTDRRGNQRILLNVQGNSISKAAINADANSIKWGFAQIGNLTYDQIFQLMSSGHHNAAHTYIMAMKFMIARDRALEKLFTAKEIMEDFGGFIARDDRGQRITDPSQIDYSNNRDLDVYHLGQKIVSLPADGSFVKAGVYYLSSGEIHDPNRKH